MMIRDFMNKYSFIIHINYYFKSTTIAPQVPYSSSSNSSYSIDTTFLAKSLVDTKVSLTEGIHPPKRMRFHPLQDQYPTQGQRQRSHCQSAHHSRYR